MYGTLYGSAPYGYAALAAAAVAVAPANLMVLSRIDSDVATLTASSEVATLPASNLQTMQPARVWRSDGVTSASIRVAFAKGVAANALALVGHNLSAAGVLRVRLASSQAALTASPGVDTGWQSAWPVTGKPNDANWPRYLSALTWTNETLYSYALVEIGDSSPLNAYVEAGRLVLGRAWRPTTNFDLAGAMPLGFDPRDVQTPSEYGGMFTDRRTRSAPRRVQVALSCTNRREALDGIADIRRQAGMWGDIVVLLDPSATTDFHRLSLQGVFTTQQEHRLTQLFDQSGELWTAEIPVREVI